MLAAVAQPTLFAAVLAAGLSTRFGASKPLAMIGDTPMVTHALRTADSVCPNRCLLILGDNARRIAATVSGEPGFVCVNEQYASGIGTSIATAVRTLRHRADALLVMLADQPMITTAHLLSLVETWDGGANAIVATRAHEALMPPVLVGRDAFPSLLDLTGDQGARTLFTDSRFSVKSVAFDDAALDIDTPDDLNRLSRNARS